jgi:hypothetical protein
MPGGSTAESVSPVGHVVIEMMSRARASLLMWLQAITQRRGAGIV